VKDCAVKRCSDFVDIYQGKTAAGITIPVDAVVPSRDLQGDAHLYQTIAIKWIRFDRKDENMRNNISSVCISPRIHIVLSSMIQTLALAEHKWSTLNHPNICPTWLLTSSNQPTEAVAMPWFTNGNIVDFMEKNPSINKLVIVCSLICLQARILFLTFILR
jgi:hypothetical protein